MLDLRSVRGLLVLGGLLLTTGVVEGCGSRELIDGGVAFTDVAIVDVAGDSLIRGITVWVVDDSVARVSPSSALQLGPNVERVDGAGRFLLPGLWDMHVHLQGTTEDVRAVEFPVYVAHGITGMRIMSGCDSAYVAARPDLAPCMSSSDRGSPTPGQVATWRNEIASGAIAGPRIVAASMIVDGPTRCYPSYALQNAAEARQRVQQARDLGADFVKITNCSMSVELYHAVAVAARSIGIPFEGHVPRLVPLIEASEAGQRGIEHAAFGLLEACGSRDGVTAAREALRSGGLYPYIEGLAEAFAPRSCEDLVVTLLENGTALSPTFLVNTNNVVNVDLGAAYEGDNRRRHLVPETRRRWEIAIEEQAVSDEERLSLSQYFDALFEAVAFLNSRGVSILAGSDAPNLLVYPGSGLHDELQMLVDAGLSPADALAAATTNPARYLGLGDQLGTIAPGVSADLVLLDADPLERIGHTREIRAVMTDGRLYHREQLDSLLTAAEWAAAGEE